GGGAARGTDHGFDNLGRQLTTDYLDANCFGQVDPEIKRVYDAPPVSCPIAGACTRTEGRLAYVKVTIMCNGFSSPIDQETFYGYDDAGRMISEAIRDNTPRGPEQQLFQWTKNGDLAQTT